MKNIKRREDIPRGRRSRTHLKYIYCCSEIGCTRNNIKWYHWLVLYSNNCTGLHRQDVNYC